MTHTSQGISPLRQRMIDDMRMRQLSPKTQANYLRIVREFSRFLGRSPDTATVEDLRGYQLHLVDHGTSPVSLNAAITGLKFFFEITLHEPDLMARMQPVRVPRTLPVVLSPDEVGRLIAATGNLKHQTALSVAYGAGLRASEVVALKVGDIDSQRMTLRIEQGKGRKDRYAMLSPVLLERLRVWWRVAHAQGRMPEGGWLFPGLDPVDPLSTRQLNRAIHAAAEAAQIDKRVSMHTLRHSFATHARTEGRYPRDPGAAGAQEAGDHRALRAGRHRPAARSDQPAGESAQDVTRGPLPCPKSRTSSARMDRCGDRRYS
jgi:site-specific recombinase XerD